VLTADDISRIPYRRGPFEATIAIVGEAPGEHEANDPARRPFIGPSGNLLEGRLRQVGLDPNQIYLTNVIKEKPDEKEIKKWIKLHHEKYTNYVALLDAELAALPNLRLIVPAGATSLEVLCRKMSIESWRGSIIPSTLTGVLGKKCVPIIHPAAILRNWLFLPATIIDLQRVKEEAEFPEIRLPERKFLIRPTFEQVMEEIHLWKTSTDLLSIDLETMPRPQRIVSFQGCVSPYRAMAIPFQYKDGRSYWPEDQELMIWKELANLLHSCGPRIIGQNILTFDLFMLMVSGFSLEKMLKNVYMDTMEAFQCLQPQLPRGLDFLTSVYTKEPYYKSEGKEWGTKQGENEFWTYGCKDVAVVHEIAPQLHKELEEENLLEFYLKRYQGLAKARLKMSRRGLPIHEPTRAKLELEFGGDIITEQAHLNVLTGQNINVKSSKQMQELLYETMKLPRQWKDGRVTCDEDAILALASKYPGDVFRHILAIRQKRTLYSNNIRARRDSDGNIRCSFGFTETGRFRSFECPLGSGGNLQNWTPKMRIMVRPPEGHVFLEGDLSQAEARVVAYAGHIEYMIKTFEEGRDIHSATAALIFNRAVETITKESPERYSAKRIVHACDYDMHANTFAKRYNEDAAKSGMPLISVEQASILLDTYHQAVPELRNGYHKWIREQVETTKLLTNPFGRRIVLHDRIGPELFRESYAWYAQSTVADVTNIILDAIIDFFDVMLQVHDSILIQCTKTDVPNIVKQMRLANPWFEVGGKLIQIPMEFKVSDSSWYEMKAYKEEIAA